jgi:hypothetical protein
MLTCVVGFGQEAPEVYADIPLTRVSMVVPEGFSLVPGFPGMSRADRGSSIVVAEVPGPFGDVLDSFTQGVGTDRTMRLVSTEDAKMNGLEAKLIVISRNENGTEFRNWLLLSGTDRATVMITATLPASAEEELGPDLKAALLSAKWDPGKHIDPFGGLEFRIQLDDAFEIRGRRTGGVLLARKEAGEDFTPDEPILMIFPSDASSIPPLEEFARQELNGSEQFKNLKLTEEHAVRVKDLTAYEITAEAEVEIGEGAPTVPVRIYLLAVRTPKKDMVIEGFVSPAKWDEYLPAFRAMAVSYEATPVPGHQH